jgi:hemolysin activation/secretion protein
LLTAAACLAGGPVQAAEPAAPPEACVQGCFVLTGLTVDGVTAYPPAALAPLYDQALAREIGMDELVRIAQRITDHYRRDGYFLSRAVVANGPDAAGHARIVVYEGYVAGADFRGDRAPAVERLLSDLAGRRPLKLQDLDHRLSLASDLPGVRVRAELEPVLDDPAQHRLAVDTRARKLGGVFYSDNRGSEAMGPWQVYGALRLNSALADGDQISLGVLTTPQDTREFSQADLAYSLPLTRGARLTAGAYASRSSDAALDNVFGSESRGINFGVALPLERRRDRSLWISAGFDARRIEPTWNGGGVADELRVLRVGAYGNGKWRGGLSTGALQVSRGLDAWGATKRPSRANSRFDADGQFWKLNARASHYRDLVRWAGVYAAVDGQWTREPLLASEEFAAGGLPYGRAYNYAEIVGDRGLAGLIELRAGWNPKVRGLTFIQGYAFLDGAKTWNVDAAPGRRSADLASAGVGLRLRLAGGAELRVEAARPLTRTPYQRGDKDWRPFAALSASF